MVAILLCTHFDTILSKTRTDIYGHKAHMHFKQCVVGDINCNITNALERQQDFFYFIIYERGPCDVFSRKQVDEGKRETD